MIQCTVGSADDKALAGNLKQKRDLKITVMEMYETILHNGFSQSSAAAMTDAMWTTTKYPVTLLSQCR